MDLNEPEKPTDAIVSDSAAGAGRAPRAYNAPSSVLNMLRIGFVFLGIASILALMIDCILF